MEAIQGPQQSFQQFSAHFETELWTSITSHLALDHLLGVAASPWNGNTCKKTKNKNAPRQIFQNITLKQTWWGNLHTAHAGSARLFLIMRKWKKCFGLTGSTWHQVYNCDAWTTKNTKYKRFALVLPQSACNFKIHPLFLSLLYDERGHVSSRRSNERLSCDLSEQVYFPLESSNTFGVLTVTSQKCAKLDEWHWSLWP